MPVRAAEEPCRGRSQSVHSSASKLRGRKNEMFHSPHCDGQIHNVKFHAILLMGDAEHRCDPQQGKNNLFACSD
jgi:hypothetical protein